jgi:phage shock protein A
MGSLLTRAWRYLVAALTGRFEEAADPKVQIEQAIQEAQDQHRQLTQRAASVIANQKKAEMDLDRAMQELEKVNGSTRQAVLMAEEARAKGDERKALEYTNTAETFANRLVSQETTVETLKQLVLQSTQASDTAKTAVDQNARRLQERLSERQKLLSQLDQARMQEQMNAALESVSATVGRDVPSLEQVRDKIETRYARARGAAELQADSVEGRMLEVEQASMNVEARARLEEIKSKLGIAAGTTQAAGEVTSGTTQASPAPPPTSERTPVTDADTTP